MADRKVQAARDTNLHITTTIQTYQPLPAVQ